MSRPIRPIELSVARLDAGLQCMAFSFNQAAEAMADFAFTYAVAAGSEEAMDAGEQALLAIDAARQHD